MYSKLAQWLCQKAEAIKLTGKDIRTRIFAYRKRKCLFDLADAIDDIHRVFLCFRAKILWRSDQIRSHFTRNEHDRSLDIDTEVITYFNKKDFDAYMADLVKRRHRAHVKEELESETRFVKEKLE